MMELETEPQLDRRGKQRVQTHYTDESLTVQSQAQRADIKFILKQYKQIGIIENLNDAEAQYMDITEYTDFADAMRGAKIAELEFMKLPSKVREIFDHDHLVWLDTAHDKEKRDALVAAGVIAAPVVDPEPARSPEVDPKPAGGEEPKPSGGPGGEAVKPPEKD